MKKSKYCIYYNAELGFYFGLYASTPSCILKVTLTIFLCNKVQENLGSLFKKGLQRQPFLKAILRCRSPNAILITVFMIRDATVTLPAWWLTSDTILSIEFHYFSAGPPSEIRTPARLAARQSIANVKFQTCSLVGSPSINIHEILNKKQLE